MREFKKRRSQKEEIFLLAVKGAGAVVLLIVTVFLMRAAWGMYDKMTTASRAQEEAETQLGIAEAQRKEINSTLSQITSERGIEQQIRERYGVVRPGEGEIDIIRDAKATSTPQVLKESWWQRIFRALFVW